VHGKRLYAKRSNTTSGVPCPWGPDSDGSPCILTVHGASKGANFYVLTLRAASLLLSRFFESTGVIDHRLNELIRRLRLEVRWAQVRTTRGFVTAPSLIAFQYSIARPPLLPVFLASECTQSFAREFCGQLFLGVRWSEQ
jgi:hypothetical protein